MPPEWFKTADITEYVSRAIGWVRGQRLPAS